MVLFVSKERKKNQSRERYYFDSKRTEIGRDMANHYEVPSWAGKAPTGHHLDVTKDDKLIQKLMIDEKKCYLFGRNKQLNDFCIDHGSCSRVHAALVYHKNLNISYLVDLGSSKFVFV